MVCAKTLAYASGCQFIAVDTFQAIAENAPSPVQQITVVEDAQRDDLFAGNYKRLPSGEWKSTSPIRIVAVEDFLRDQSPEMVVVGPGLRKFDTEQIVSNWLTTPEFCQARAATIAALGSNLIASTTDAARTDDFDFWKASPFYLRMSAAEEKRAADDLAKASGTSA